MTRKINHICKDCGHALYWDATAVWDVETQSFEMTDTNDFHACQECESENCCKTVDVETGEEVKQGPDWTKGYLPVAEAEAAWQAFTKQRRVEYRAKVAAQEAEAHAKANAAALAAYQETDNV